MHPTSPPTPTRIAGPHGPIPALLAGDPARARASVLIGHGLGGTLATQWPEAQRLAARGFAALAVEAPHHGLRADTFLTRMAAASAAEARILFLDLVQAWCAEIPALVDHLASVGATRFVAAGVSMGGHLALGAPGVEPRIGAVVAFNADPVWEDRPQSPHLHLETWAKVPLLAVTADGDEIVPPDSMRVFATRLQSRFGPGHARSLTYPGGHMMSPGDWEDAWDQVLSWLAARFP